MLRELYDALWALGGMSFVYPWVLWGLLVLLPLAVFDLWPRKSRQAAVSHPRVAALRAAGRGWRSALVPLPRVLRIVALAFLIVALARPQSAEREERRVEGIDIYLVLDMSGSMQAIDLNLAQVQHLQNQGKTPSNRFENAVSVLSDFVVSRRDRCNQPGDELAARCDRIGMVIFGKNAFLEFPLTLDYGTILNLLRQRKLEDIDGSGTAIGNALGRAVAGLRHSGAESKVIVLITDGDRRGGDISPAQGASMAQHFGINVFPILVGREGPTLIPSEAADFWGAKGSYQQVEFPVNPELLEKLATMTNGRFYRSSDRASLEKDLHDILDRFERSEIEADVNVSTTEHYPPYALAGMLLLLLDAGLSFVFLRRFP